MLSTVLSTLGLCLYSPSMCTSNISNFYILVPPYASVTLLRGFTKSIAVILSLMCHTYYPLVLCTHIKQNILPITGNSLTLLTHLYKMQVVQTLPSIVQEGHSVKQMKMFIKLIVNHHVILTMEDVLIMKCAPYNNNTVVQVVPVLLQ